MARKSIDEIYRPMPGDEPPARPRDAMPPMCGLPPCGRTWVCLLMAPLAIAFAGLVMMYTPCGPLALRDARLVEAAAFVRTHEQARGHFPASLPEAGADIAYSTDCRPVEVVAANELQARATFCPGHEGHRAYIGLSGRSRPLVIVRSSAR